MGRIKPLKNVIRHYAWGSLTAIPELINIPPSVDLPCAELWMGAHPGAPSEIIHQGQSVSLGSFIRHNPDDILGPRIAGKFQNTLPFLLKVLAAASPLSIQAHPDSKQAREGFLRENESGIPLDAPERNYRDPYHKPECICALTPFFALCGFRKPSDIINNFLTILPGESESLIAGLKKNPDNNGLKAFFHQLLVIDKPAARDFTARAVDYAKKHVDLDPLYRWVVRLNQEYPDDIMALAPVFLNLIELAPQQALFLPAGVLHSYLEGVGVELMAGSDNVLRGGLTPKHIDVEELLKVLDFSSISPRLLSPVSRSGCEQVYDTAAEEFILSVVRVLPDQDCSPHLQNRVAILLCVDGSAVIKEQANGETTTLAKGTSVIIPASVSHYTLSGEAVIYKASVPL